MFASHVGYQKINIDKFSMETSDAILILIQRGVK